MKLLHFFSLKKQTLKSNLALILLLSISGAYTFDFVPKGLCSSFTRSIAAKAPAPKVQATPVVTRPQFKNWGIDNSAPTMNLAPSHIQALEAWKIEKGQKNIIIAIVDTGIDPKHPDLATTLLRDSQTPPRSQKNLAESFGWDFSNDTAFPLDDHGHGTHVAGIIAGATNMATGTSGVAPQVSLLPIKYYSEKNSGQKNLANTIKALNYAIDRGARIINYSGGGPKFSQEEYLALKKAEQAGILVVAAAGNNQQNIDLPENEYFPASYKLDNIISVTATNIQNEMLRTSNWGLRTVHVAAPGENIYSTIPGKSYGFLSGTSQATAFVTGLAALILSKNPNLTPAQIKEFIVKNVDVLPTFKDKISSGGKINAYKTLFAVTEAMKLAQTLTLKPSEKKQPQKILSVRKIASPLKQQ